MHNIIPVNRLKILKTIKYKSAYIDSPNTPQYAFGHGLSYTTFTYTNLKLSKAVLSENESAELSFTLSNTGKIAGEEVVQLYIYDLVASTLRTLKELKAFQKISLKAGESKEVKFIISKEKLSFFNSDLQWVVEPGDFKLMVGTASDQIKLENRFDLRK